MDQIKVDETTPKYRIDYDYETWRTNKVIKNAFKSINFIFLKT